MENKINYGKVLEETLRRLEIEGVRPRLLLHACCAPCSSYVLEYLAERFAITLYFYNPNIAPAEEYDFRFRELARLVEEVGYRDMPILRETYDAAEFESIAQGLENEPEGGARCYKCYRLRLTKAAEAAKAGGFDYFTTTLSISPHKRADWLNEIGRSLGDMYAVPYLTSDFKKKGGYQRSIVLSKEHNLYRQPYCGCKYSMRNAENGRQNCDNPVPPTDGRIS